MHITGHNNIDCYVTHTMALQFLLRLVCVALKFVDDDDDDDDADFAPQVGIFKAIRREY